MVQILNSLIGVTPTPITSPSLITLDLPSPGQDTLTPLFDTVFADLYTPLLRRASLFDFAPSTISNGCDRDEYVFNEGGHIPAVFYPLNSPNKKIKAANISGLRPWPLSS